jgi:hypothetical protein
MVRCTRDRFHPGWACGRGSYRAPPVCAVMVLSKSLREGVVNPWPTALIGSGGHAVDRLLAVFDRVCRGPHGAGGRAR